MTNCCICQFLKIFVLHLDESFLTSSHGLSWKLTIVLPKQHNTKFLESLRILITKLRQLQNIALFYTIIGYQQTSGSRMRRVVSKRVKLWRNPREEWGLELRGGWEEDRGSWIEISRVRPGKVKSKKICENQSCFWMSSLLGSPADRAGCRAGDLLLSLNGLMVLFLSAEISLQLLEDMEDTLVTLQLERYSTGTWILTTWLH
jgi:hypothetical protein